MASTLENQTTATTPQDQQQQPPPTPIPSPILTLPNCLIRPYHPSDAAPMAAAANTPLISRNMRNTFPNPYTLDSANAWIRISTARPPLRNFAILSAPDGADFYGGIGLRPLEDVECRTCEVGYWIAPAHWGRGLATEALRAFSRWAFEQFGELLRLEASVYSTNEASGRVLAKAGFTYEGTRRKAIWKNGEVLDIKIYSLLRVECLGQGK